MSGIGSASGAQSSVGDARFDYNPARAKYSVAELFKEFVQVDSVSGTPISWRVVVS